MAKKIKPQLCARCKGYTQVKRSLCDYCIAEEFGLNDISAQYDSEDELGMTELFRKEDVIKALEKYWSLRD